MTTIFERVDDALTTLSPPVPYALAPYKSGDLPDIYIVYQLIVSPAELHADDAETERSYTMQVTVWDVNGLVNLPDIDTVMIAEGFYKSDQRQLPQDPDTGHYGLATDYVYL
jgi:hypothetical protein